MGELVPDHGGEWQEQPEKFTAKIWCIIMEFLHYFHVWLKAMVLSVLVI